MKFITSKLPIALAITLIALLGYTVACTKEAEPIIIQTPVSAFLKFEGKTLNHVNATFDSFESQSNDNQNLKFNIAYTGVDEPSMKYLLSQIDERYSLGVKSSGVVGVVIYTKVKDLAKITLDDIAGISTFTPVDKETNQHNLYVLDGQKKLIKDEPFTAKTDKLLVHDFAYIGAYVLKGMNNINAISYTSPSYMNGDRNQVIFELSQIVFEKSNVIIQRNPESKAEALERTYSGGDCATNCYGGGSFCEPPPQGGSSQCQGLCSFGVASSLQSPNSRIGSSLSEDKVYGIRNGFMQKTAEGQKYIDYYYKLSDVSRRYNLITYKTAPQYMKAAVELVSIVNNLENGDANKIVIDAEAQALFTDLIKSFRSKSSNLMLVRILDDIEKDLKIFSLKSKTEVSKALNQM